jgi:hypothetical protein
MQVRDFYLTTEDAIKDKMDDISKMKKRIERLEENMEGGSGDSMKRKTGLDAPKRT